MIETPYVSTQELADALGVTLPRVYQLLGEGRLPGVRSGARWRITREAWRLFLERQTAAALDRVTSSQPAG
jgi:excisionase family DNA binding protein